MYGLALANSISGHIERGRALEQYSRACHGLGDNYTACQKSLEASLIVRNLDYKVSQRYIDLAISYARLSENADLYIHILEEYFLNGEQTPENKETVCEKLYYLTPHMVRGTIEDYIIPIFGIHTYFLLNHLPPLIQRQIFSKTLDQLVDLRKDGLNAKLFYHSIFSILVAVNPEVLIKDDLINIGDILNDNIEEISFKPDSHGNMNFWLNLELGKTLTLSIETFDNRKDTQAACLLLIVFLMGFQKEIQEQIIMDFEFQRDELQIIISSNEEITDDLKSFFEEALIDQYCAVPRLVSLIVDSNMPLYIVCRGDIAKNWKTATGSATSIQMLISYTLAELAYRLYEGEVELDSIRPKIIGIVKDTIS